MSLYELGKDVQEIKARLSALESSIQGRSGADRGAWQRGKKPCNCKSAAAATGSEGTLHQEEDDKGIAYKYCSMKPWSAGDCQITYMDVFVYENGDWRVNFMAKDNGTFFGDDFYLHVSIRDSGKNEIEKFQIFNNFYIGAGGSNQGPATGHSEQIRKLFNNINIYNTCACVGCNEDCQPTC